MPCQTVTGSTNRRRPALTIHSRLTDIGTGTPGPFTVTCQCRLSAFLDVCACLCADICKTFHEIPNKPLRVLESSSCRNKMMEFLKGWWSLREDNHRKESKGGVMEFDFTWGCHAFGPLFLKTKVLKYLLILTPLLSS